MSSTKKFSRWRPVGWPRVAVLSMVLLGIFGMHVLAAHCPPDASHVDEISTASLISHQAEKFSASATTSANAPNSADASGGSAEAQLSLNGVGVVGVCMAALAAVVWGLAFTRFRAHHAWWGIPMREAMRPLSPARSRPPRPPTLAQLSLLRC
jgi:hypothetical protein